MLVFALIKILAPWYTFTSGLPSYARPFCFCALVIIPHAFGSSVEKVAKGWVIAFFAVVGYVAGVLVFGALRYLAVYLPNIFQLLTTSWFLSGLVGMAFTISLVSLYSALSKPTSY